MPQNILCINGPNLNRLGSRDPAVYGSMSLAELEDQIRAWAREYDQEVGFLQTNDESELIDALHATDAMGVVLNPGAFTHSSIAVRDAIESVDVPVVEVHLSNVLTRDRFRRRSVIGSVTVRTIFGRGPDGYRYALAHLRNRTAGLPETHRYGPHPDQIFDIHRANEHRANAILIHGGFWRSQWTRDTVEGWAVDLAGHGLSSAVIEYRRLDVGGGHPSTHNDVAMAVDRALGILEPGPTVVVGHSAGAHLAVTAAPASGRRLDRIIGLGGVYHFDAIGAQDPAADVVGRMRAAGAADPDTAALPPGDVRLVHGAEDSVVSPGHTQRYRERFEAAGRAVTVDLLDGVGHFDYLDPRHPSWTLIRDRHITAEFDELSTV